MAVGDDRYPAEVVACHLDEAFVERTVAGDGVGVG